jgi:hypothetical protein
VHAVETGVARGVTTRFILEALDRNGSGDLSSVDLPPVLEEGLHEEIAIAVPEANRDRWTLCRGSSRQQLPALLDRLGSIRPRRRRRLQPGVARIHRADTRCARSSPTTTTAAGSSR